MKRRVRSVTAGFLWRSGVALSLVACSESLPEVPDTGPPIPDLFGPTEDVVIPDDTPVAPDSGPPPTNQCSEAWTYTMPESGTASHPIVDDENRAVIAAGDTLRRVLANGTNDPACTPFRQPGDELGTPALSATGTLYVGGRSGRMFAVSRQCAGTWASPPVLRELACASAQGEAKVRFCTAGEGAIREAPALLDGALFVVDATPALYRLNDVGAQAEFVWSHLSVDNQPLAGSAPVIAGGDVPFVAFATLQTVVAVDTTGGRRWSFEELLAGEPRVLTGPLAVTKEGDLLLVTGRPNGDAFDDLLLYRLRATSPDKKARVAPGFPKAIPIVSDAVRGMAVAPDESIVLAMAGNGVVRLDPSGALLWKFIGDAESLRATSVPTLGDDGSIFVTAEPRFVYGVSGDGRLVFRYESPGEGVKTTTSPAIRPDGTVLVHFGSELKAYACTETSGLATSSWPRYQRNNRNTGNLGEPE